MSLVTALNRAIDMAYPWVMTHPFGIPVVPEVYKSDNMVEGLIVAPGRPISVSSKSANWPSARSADLWQLKLRQFLQ